MMYLLCQIEVNKHNQPVSLVLKNLYFFILFLLVSCFAFAQPKSFRIYTVNDGLISNSPQHIFQDNDGFIWIGSLEGLSIYNGYHFVNYTTENKGLSNNIIGNFFEYSKQEMWVLHKNGIDVFVKRKFTKTLPVEGISFIFRARDQRILATGRGGIYEFKGKQPHLIYSAVKFFYSLFEIGGYFLACENPWESIVLFD